MKQKRDRIANLFRRLSRILDGDRILPSEKPLASLSSLNAKELREAFLAELKLLNEKRQDVSDTFGKELTAMSAMIERANDKQLYANIEPIRETLTRIRRSLFRSALALQSDRQIQSEWAEWKRLAGQQTTMDTIRGPIQRERLEMLGSECILRRLRGGGVRTLKGELLPTHQSTLLESKKTEDLERIAPAPLPLFVKKEKPRASLESWDAFYSAAVLESANYWEELMSDIETGPFSDPHELADLFHSLKRAHGELRLHDREKRVRRYRLAAFVPQN